MEKSIVLKKILKLSTQILLSTFRTIYDIKFEFKPKGDAALPSSDRQLKHLINEKIQRKEFFYGLEITGRNYNPNTIPDFHTFGPVQPLFTSIIWRNAKYWSVENIKEVESIKIAQTLQPRGIVLLHFTCYHLKEKRLKEFLDLNISNILVIRGDSCASDQEYKHTEELVEKIRKLKGDSVTIGVAGYPERHPEFVSMDQNFDSLVKKVKAGADFIITQACFTPQPVIGFLIKCRSIKIKIPILVGVYVPDNMNMLETILRITKTKMSPEVLEEYKRQSSLGHKEFNDYAVSKAVDMIETIFSSDADVYGLQFFTLNQFKNIPQVLNEIYKNQNLINFR